MQLTTQTGLSRSGRILLLTVATTVLGLEALRVFATNLVWYLGETSDRVVMAVVAFLAFGTVGVIWPVLKIATFRQATLIGTAGLVLTRLVDQANSVPVIDLVLGFLGTMFFGWLVVSRLGRGGQIAGIGMAAALAIDIAIRAAFDTADLPFVDSVWALLIVLTLGTTAAAALWKAPNADDGQVSAISAWPLFGIPSCLLLFMLVTGNFGQVAVRGELDWAETVLWLSAGAAAGLIRALLPRGQSWKRTGMHAVLSGAALGGGIAAYWGGTGGLWVGVAALGLAHLLSLLPANPTMVSKPGGGGAEAAFVSAGFILFVALLFTFYSFYGPEWIVTVLVAVVVICGLGRVTMSQDMTTTPLAGPGRWIVAVLLVVSVTPGLWKALTYETPAMTELEDGQVLVLSYNIRQGFGLDDRLDLERVATEIEKHNPDVVALQEMGRGWIISGMIDQVQWLANRLGMQAHFVPNLADTWGNAFLVKVPVINQGHVRFDDQGRVPRGVQAITVPTDRGNLRILVTHLDSEDDGAQVRMGQLAVVLTLWDSSTQSLIVGDMNFTPDTTEYTSIVSSGLRDLLLEVGNDQGTWPSDDPTERIDYAFGTDDLHLLRADSPMSYASDHLPIIVEVQLP